MTWSKAEYIVLRLVRRFLFSGRFLEKFGFLVPYYRLNSNRLEPAPVCDRYETLAGRQGVGLGGKTVLEIGVGATNSTAYCLAARGCSRVIACEPFARFDARADERQLMSLCRAGGGERETIAGRVERVTVLSGIPAGSIDLVFSNSVLEHVRDLSVLFSRLRTLLKPDGVMIHVVDYRDHFFKYPYHLLMFSKKTWERWLDPGDLPGRRLRDHLTLLDDAGFKVTVEDEKIDKEKFAAIADRVAPEYDRSDSTLAVCTCTLIARKRCP